MVNLRQFYELSPKRIAVGYAVFGVLWIGLSDRLVRSAFGSEATIALAQTIKGWVFVGVSAAVIYWLSRLHEGQLAVSEKRAIAATEQLQVLQRIFRHNIRNELTVIHGYAELLLDRTQRDRTEQWAHGILESSNGLLETSEKLGIVNNVDFESEVESTIDLVPMLEAELATLRSSYPQATIEVEIPDRLFAYAKPSIQYGFREALHNTMDHHPLPESERQVTLSATKTVSTVTLEIWDDGRGIHRDEVEPISAGTETPLEHTSGIGLWLIAWTCESSGGAVRFESNGGTSVFIELEHAEPVEQVAETLHQEVVTGPGE